ncbi:transcription initiation factor TFIID subunit 11 [Silene latifolia]|uniref:transcription initiation factor TFIID subunit 11 n=1 Tax=Silene latifolia TaxID=37657 RepID=UPI003D774D0A
MSKDPFEAAFEEQEESPPESPATAANVEENQLGVGPSSNEENHQPEDVFSDPNVPSSSTRPPLARTLQLNNNKTKDEDGDDEDEDEQMDVAMGKFPPSGDPDKLAKMQTILSQFTEEQMSRYEAFRRAGFQKSNMKRLLVSITGSQKISVPMTIVVSGIAKMFVGELVETAKIVMSERRETGPIRPCHMREAYRRLKLEGKVPRRSVSRLFR